MRESVAPSNPLLPIDALIPSIKSSLQQHHNLIIEATPGAGKTTRIPPALLSDEISGQDEVWVLEPRRIAARLSARRVAEELGEELGATVGYQVRFEEISSSMTRLRFLTEGVLTRRLLSNPLLSGVAVVVLDEFHERHLQTDLALALLRNLQKTKRPDLKLVVMSATLETARLSSYLGDCPTLQCQGRQFNVTTDFLKHEDARPLPEQVVAALKKLLTTMPAGDVLVFLPGARAIKQTFDVCTELAIREKLLITMLHGGLSTSEQDRAIRQYPQRKVILATNVAETSITIDGVTAIIDSGLARIARHSPWSGLPSLETRRISRAAAIQRAGRAGRTLDGVCLRLFTAMDFATRTEFEKPEIQRLDLSSTILEIHAAGSANPMEFNWFESPEPDAIEAAEELLKRLGAIDQDGDITPIGKHMLRLPLHPRQARLVLEAQARGVVKRGALIAVLLSEGDLRNKTLAPPYRSPTTDDKNYLSYLEEQERLFWSAEKARFRPSQISELSLNLSQVKNVDRAYQQILQLFQPGADNDLSPSSSDEQLTQTILAAYPDRVGKIQESDNAVRGHSNRSGVKVMMGNGSWAQLKSGLNIKNGELLVALEADEKSSNRSSQIQIQTAISIQPEMLLELFPESITDSVDVAWDAKREGVNVVGRLMYEKLVLDESLVTATQINQHLQAEIAAVLFAAVKRAGWQRFLNEEHVNRIRARVDFLNRVQPKENLPNIIDDVILMLLEEKCGGQRSFSELQSTISVETLMHSFFRPDQIGLLERFAPEKISLPRRKNVRVSYEMNQPPWITSRLQDFFGLKSGPKIGDGQVPLVLHLLAPNQRPVQITQDLSSFWERIYPQIRRELSRRYPKHAWPENPIAG